MLNDLFRPLGPDGVHARTAIFERVVSGLDRFITAFRAPEAEVLRLPPVMSRSQLETSGYLKSFPHLLGCVCALHGSEAEVARAVAGGWTASLAPTDLVLSPAACYPLYPMAASRGPLPAGGLLFDVACECFRHEPSAALDRLQSFRMREYVRIGTPSDVLAFRTGWVARAQDMATRLGLAARVAVASDPFFGRDGLIMAASQMQQELKFEVLVDIFSESQPTACMSCNYHREHFGTVWNIRDSEGATAHTACVAFGMDRLALALFATHGMEWAGWPEAVRELLV